MERKGGEMMRCLDTFGVFGEIDSTESKRIRFVIRRTW